MDDPAELAVGGGASLLNATQGRIRSLVGAGHVFGDRIVDTFHDVGPNMSRSDGECGNKSDQGFFDIDVRVAEVRLPGIVLIKDWRVRSRVWENDVAPSELTSGV